MKARRIIAGLVLIDFIALNLWALYNDGAAGLVEWMMTAHNTWHYVAVADLFIALGVCIAFMWRENAQSESKPVLETVLTFLGSVGPLLYLARRKEA